MWQEWKQVEIDIKAMTDEIERISNENALCRRLRQIPGFGPLVSTATVAAIGNGAAFRRGRDFAAWVGVVPRQYSTGGKQKLFGISKRGNVYLRRMLIHGARAVLLRVKYDTAGFGQWVHRLAQRAPRNKVVVAIANKLARIAWAVLSSGKDYQHQPLQITAAGYGRGKDAALGKHRTLSTFPPPRRRSFEVTFHQGLLRREEDERTVQRRVGKPDVDNASLVTERFIRTDTRGSSSSARRAILH